MAQSTTITPNYFVHAGYKGAEVVDAFKVWRYYEPHLSNRGRSVFGKVKGIIKECSKERSKIESLNYALSELTGKERSLDNILGIKTITFTDAKEKGIFADKKLAKLARLGGSRLYLKDGNSIGHGIYSVARKADEERDRAPLY